MERVSNILSEWSATRDEPAFRALYESMYHPLLDLACRYVEGETARDIVQDSFLRLWSAPENYTRIGDLRFYMFRSIQNRCLNHIRNRKVEDRYRDMVDPGAEDFFYNVLLEEELFIEMRQAVDRLPEIYRDVLSLGLDGLSTKDIALKLGISEDTVKTRRKRGKEMLRGTLKNPLLLILIEMI